MVAQWASPEFSTAWDERKSLCYKDLAVVLVDPSTTATASPGIAGHCKLIRIEEPTADGAAPAPEEVEAAQESTSAEPAAEPAAEPEAAEHPPDRRWTLSASLGTELEPDLRRLAGLIGGQLSLRTGSHVVFNPRIGLHLLHITEPNDEAGRLSAAMLDLGLRIQQPLRGAYLDVEAGGFEGFKAEPGGPSEATGGLTLGAGVGWRWERLELGAEARTLLPLTEAIPIASSLSVARRCAFSQLPAPDKPDRQEKEKGGKFPISVTAPAMTHTPIFNRFRAPTSICVGAPRYTGSEVGPGSRSP